MREIKSKLIIHTIGLFLTQIKKIKNISLNKIV